MSKFIDVTMRLIDDFTSPLSNAVNKMQESARKTIRAGKEIESAGKSISNVGSTLTKSVTLPIVGVGTAMVTTAATFQSKMSGVKAITQATGDEFSALKDEAVKLGGSTAFSAGEVADAMTEMAKAGWSTQQILDGMSGVLDAAAASGESLGSTSTIVADAITGFGLTAGDSSMVADLLTQAANAGTIGISDLGETFKYIAPVANAMNFSISDVTTAVSAMSMAGIKGSQAGTALRTTLTNLVKPTDAMEKAMDKLGISVTNKDGSFKSLDDIVANLRGSFSGLTDEQKTYYAATLAGKEGMSGLLAMLNLTEEEYNNIALAMDNSNGVAKTTAEIMQDNLLSKFEQLGGAVESLGIKMGDYLIPPLTDIVEKATTVVEWFTNLSESTQKTILKFAGIAAAIGPAIFAFGKVVGIIGTVTVKYGKFMLALKKAGSLWALIASPANIVVAVLAAIVVAGVLVYKNWDKIKEMAGKAWKYIGKVISNSGVDVDALKEKALGLRDKFVDTWDKIKNKLKQFWDFAQPIFTTIAGVFVAVLPHALAGVISMFGSWFDSTMNIVGYIVDAFVGLGDFFSNIFVGNFKDAWNGLKDFMGSIAKAIVEMIKTPFNALISLINGAINSINKIGIDIPSWVPNWGGKSFGFDLATIPMLYKGTDDWKGGPAMVHDRGAEILDLPSGTRVVPHDKSLQMAKAEGARSASGANITIAKIADSIVVREDADIDKIATALVDKLVKIKNNTGGVLIGDMA